jgi:hypothetical protein
MKKKIIMVEFGGLSPQAPIIPVRPRAHGLKIRKIMQLGAKTSGWAFWG